MTPVQADGWKRVLGAVVALTGMGVVVDAFRLVAGLPPDGTVPEVESAMTAQLCAIAVPLLLVLVWPLGAAVRGRRPIGAWLVGAYAVALAAWLPFVLFAYPTLLRALDVAIAPQPHLDYFRLDADRPRWLLVAFVVCVAGPIAEEIVFRGYLQTGLRALLGPWRALVLVALLFGLLHGLEDALPIALIGALFGYLREREDGMLAPVLAHVLHNTTMIALAANTRLLDGVFAR